VTVVLIVSIGAAWIGAMILPVSTAPNGSRQRLARAAESVAAAS
jgi:hypothetical protein